MTQPIIFLLFVAFCSLQMAEVFGLNATDWEEYMHEQKLHKQLLANYTKTTRPLVDHRNAVTVELGLALVQIEDLDEKNHLLTTYNYMRMAWKDAFLAWDPAEYGGVTTTRIQSSDIWTPDLVPYNSFRGAFEHVFEALAVVSSDGGVLLIPAVRLQSTCSVDMTHFPYDQQICYIKFGSWTYSDREMNITHYYNMESLDLSDYIGHMEWRLLETKAVRNMKYYPCCVEGYADITYQLNLERTGSRFKALFVVPAVVMALLVPVMFVLPPYSGEKTTLGVGILLVIVLLLCKLDEHLPNASGNIPVLMSFYITCVVLTSLSLAVSAFIVSVSYSRTSMPRWLRTFVLKPLTCVMCVCGDDTKQASGQAISFRQLEAEPLDDLSQPSDDRQRMTPSGDQRNPAAVGDWRRLATALDRLCLCIFLLVVIITMLQMLPRALSHN